MAETPPSTQRRVTTLTDISSNFKLNSLDAFERKLVACVLADGNAEDQGGEHQLPSEMKYRHVSLHTSACLNDYQPSKSPQPTFFFFAFRSSGTSPAAGASRARFKYLPTPPPDTPLPMAGEELFKALDPTASPNQFTFPSTSAFLCCVSEGARVVDACDWWASFFASLFLYSSKGS
jgi:hypothetical protein